MGDMEEGDMGRMVEGRMAHMVAWDLMDLSDLLHLVKCFKACRLVPILVCECLSP